MSRCGYHGTILWIDLTTKMSKLDTRDETFCRRYVGGGLLATQLLLEHTPPGIDPLGPENLLIFASSVVAGHLGAGLARFTTAAKSPLMGGIGETRTEGPWGVALEVCGAAPDAADARPRFPTPRRPAGAGVPPPGHGRPHHTGLPVPEPVTIAEPENAPGKQRPGHPGQPLGGVSVVQRRRSVRDLGGARPGDGLRKGSDDDA
jgi:hypothetical protein